MKQAFFCLGLVGAAAARPTANNFMKREVPQEHAHQNVLDVVSASLNTNNPNNIADPVFGLLGAKAAAEGAGKIADPDCLQLATADQAFTNAKAAGDVKGQTFALIYRALERNTGSVGLASVPCTSIKAVNPEIAALQQHQDPASAGAQALNKEIAQTLVAQITSIGGDTTLANEASTFAPGKTGDPTAKGNTCDDAADKAGCINSQKLRVDDLTADEIAAAASSAGTAGNATAGAGNSTANAGTSTTGATNATAAAVSTGSANDTTPCVLAPPAAVSASTNGTSNAKGKDKGKNKGKGNKKGKNEGNSKDQGMGNGKANSTSTGNENGKNNGKANAEANGSSNGMNKGKQNGMNEGKTNGNENGMAKGAQKGMDKGKQNGNKNGNQNAKEGGKQNGKGDAMGGANAAKGAAGNSTAAATTTGNAKGGAAAAGVAEGCTLASATAAPAASPASAGAASTASGGGAASFGTCKDVTIKFGIPADRQEAAFQASDLTTFNHGSALNIGVISGFICSQLQSKCGADAAAVTKCNEAEASSKALKGQAAADAFNSAIKV